MTSVCIIATNRYREYAYVLIASIYEYFLPNHNVEINLFTDQPIPYIKPSERVNVRVHIIPDYTFPDASLLRWEIMTSIPQNEYGDYIFYIDADSLITSQVGDEILSPITLTLHPGYFCGGGSWGNDKKSLSYTQPEKRKKYFCGGFFGASSDHFYAICNLLKRRTAIDTANGVTATWHDETHLNWYASENGGFKELSPEYMMPQPLVKRTAWGIDHFEPKILALEKPKNFRV